MKIIWISAIMLVISIELLMTECSRKGDGWGEEVGCGGPWGGSLGLGFWGGGRGIPPRV